MEKINLIFDSKKDDREELYEFFSSSIDRDVDIELWDMSSKKYRVRQKANSLFYQHGAIESPLWLFENDGDTYNSHYVEHGPLTKELFLKKLNNG